MFFPLFEPAGESFIETFFLFSPERDPSKKFVFSSFFLFPSLPEGEKVRVLARTFPPSPGR